MLKAQNTIHFFEPLVNVTKIDCGDYLITYNDWHGFESAIQVKRDKRDSHIVKKQANQLADMINYNTNYMLVIDDLPPPEITYVTFEKWQDFETKGRKWEDCHIVIC